MHYILCCNTSVNEGFNSVFKVSDLMALVLGDNHCDFKSDLMNRCHFIDLKSMERIIENTRTGREEHCDGIYQPP